MRLLWFVAAPHVIESVIATVKSGHMVDVILPTWLMDPVDIDVDNVTVHQSFNDEDYLVILDQVLAQGNTDYVVPSFPDHAAIEVSEICRKHGKHGCNKFAATVFSSKRKYYHAWKTLGIPTPKIYSSVDVVKLPCIAKPVWGISGKGIEVLHTHHRLSEFLNIQSYLLQEYIVGDVVSVMGTVINGNIKIDLVYDIESNNPPQVAETGLCVPSKHADIAQQIIPYLKQFFEFTQFDSMPFMLDLIVDKAGQIYFLDFGARLSVNGQMLMNHAGEKTYVSKVIARLHGINSSIDLGQAALFRQLGLRVGKIKEISCRNSKLAAKLELPSQVTETLQDDCVYRNGYAIIVGSTRNELEECFQQLVDSITVTYLD